MNATAIYFFNFDDKSKRVDNSNNNSNSNSSYNNNSNNSINNNSSNNNKNNKYSSDLSTEKRETPHQQQEIETDNFQILYTNPITPNFTNSTPTSISITLPQKVKTQFPNLNSITLNYNTFIKVENLNQNQLNELNNDHLLNFNVYTLDQEEDQDMLNPIKNKIFKHKKQKKESIPTTTQTQTQTPTTTKTNTIESKNKKPTFEKNEKSIGVHQVEPCQQQQQQQHHGQYHEQDQLQPCQQGEPNSTESTPPNESIISEVNNNNKLSSPEMESSEEKYYKQHPMEDDDSSVYTSPTSSTSSIISSTPTSTVNTPAPSPSSSPMYLTLSSADSPLPSLSSILGPISFSLGSAEIENADIPIDIVLKGIVVEDLDGNECLLTDLWAKKRCVIAVFRRFGCLVCRLQALDLSSLKPKFDQLGIQLIGIGFDPTGLAEFIHGQFFQGTIYLDRNRAVHRSLCLKRMGFWDSAVGFTDPRLTVYRKRAKDIGLPHNFKGDGMQLGATIVVGPQPQGAHYDFRQRGFTDIFDLNQILKACKSPLPEKISPQEKRYKLPPPINLPCSPIHFNLEIKPPKMVDTNNNDNNHSNHNRKPIVYHFGNKEYHLKAKEHQPQPQSSQQQEIDPQLLQKVEQLSNQLLSTGIKSFDEVFNNPTIGNYIKNVHISNSINNNNNNNLAKNKNEKKRKLSAHSKLWMKLEPETDLIYLPY